MITRVTTFAPASISNLGSGFDVLGVAIDKPGDRVIAKRKREPGLIFSVTSSGGEVPLSAKQNVAAHVASLMIKEFNVSFGIEMTLHKRMPIGSGLGSSAASSVAAAVAVNALLPKPLPKCELLRFAVEGERMASGSPHADNAAPSLLGGVCLIRSYEPLDMIQLPVQRSLIWVVVHPHVIIRTEEARSILPKTVSMRNAVHQWGNVSGLTAGLIAGNALLAGKCVEDVIVEPVRARLIPAFEEVKHAALRNGATGCSISGSGPSMFAIAPSLKQAAVIGKAMQGVFTKKARVQSELYISRTNMTGATILSQGKE